MNEATIFRSATDGFLYYTINGVTEPLELFQDNVFKLPPGDYSIVNNSGYTITQLITTDGVPTYKLETPQIVVSGGGGGRGPAGKQGPAGSGVVPIYGQAYSKSTQTVTQNNPVVWDAIQNGLGVTLTNANKDIQVSTAGTYQVDWVIEFQITFSPS